jgi:hypothetical protein
MATFTIQFSVADAHMERIRYALRKQFGPKVETVTNPETGEVTSTSRDLNGDELLWKVRQLSIDNIKAIVMSVEAGEAAQAARDSVTAVIVE